MGTLSQFNLARSLEFGAPTSRGIVRMAVDWRNTRLCKESSFVWYNSHKEVIFMRPRLSFLGRPKLGRSKPAVSVQCNCIISVRLILSSRTSKTFGLCGTSTRTFFWLLPSPLFFSLFRREQRASLQRFGVLCRLSTYGVNMLKLHWTGLPCMDWIYVSFEVHSTIKFCVGAGMDVYSRHLCSADRR